METAGKSITDAVADYKPFLGDADFEFLNRVYSAGLDAYKNRLKAIGFEGHGKVLDAGCGFGQWAMALAEMNDEVVGTDLASARLIVGGEVAKSMGLNNVSFQYSGLENQPFEDNTFDAVFCYGAIFLADTQQALHDFYRVLKPGGKLYTNANGLGWSINLWKNAPNKTSDYDPKANVAKHFTNTVLYSQGLPKGPSQLIIEKDEMQAMVEKAGFSGLKMDGEGKLKVDPNMEVKPFFKDEYYGFTGIYELIATK